MRFDYVCKHKFKNLKKIILNFFLNLFEKFYI